MVLKCVVVVVVGGGVLKPILVFSLDQAEQKYLVSKFCITAFFLIATAQLNLTFDGIDYKMGWTTHPYLQVTNTI